MTTGFTEQQSQAPQESSATNSAAEQDSYDIPRPLLTIAQAAAILGKSIRTLERSLIGRWGNKLPEGWTARKIETDKGGEWRIVPPPGFRLRQAQKPTDKNSPESPPESSLPGEDPSSNERWSLQSTRHPGYWLPEHHNLEQPTIVIDRSEEVERLLRELVTAQKSLAEERRLHLEDLRTIAQMQSSMKLLESNVSDQNQLKFELANTTKQLEELKRDYNHLAQLPWWKRMLAHISPK